MHSANQDELGQRHTGKEWHQKGGLRRTDGRRAPCRSTPRFRWTTDRKRGQCNAYHLPQLPRILVVLASGLLLLLHRPQQPLDLVVQRLPLLPQRPQLLYAALAVRECERSADALCAAFLIVWCGSLLTVALTVRVLRGTA